MDYEQPNFLQSPEWAEVNRRLGHKVLEQTYGGGGRAVLIVKNAKRGRYLEIPGGPLMDWSQPAAVDAAFAKIKAVATAEGCVFIRLRPQLLKTPEHLATLARVGAKPAPFHLHAEHTVILDLTKSEDQLLADMRRQTRYEVRRAAKLGLSVTSATDEATFRTFHQVQLETAKRQNFIPPSLNDLLAYHAVFGDQATIYTALDPESQPIAFGLILVNGSEAEYFEAASTELNRKLPGAYVLQWQVIKDLKAQGIERYNLWGIAPPGQPNHRYAGVTTFKTGFGGETVEFVPAHDIVINPLKYQLTKTVENIRKKRRHLS